MSSARIRARAAAILARILQEKGSLGTLMAAEAARSPVPPLLKELCYGVCRWYQRLDFIRSQLMKKPLKAKDLDVQCLILLGLYQLFHMRTPSHAAINETVAAVKKTWAKGLVNAVLREAERSKAALLDSAEKTDVSKYSHPSWLLDTLKQAWPEDYKSILEANNTQAPMTLRVNLGQGSRETYLQTLAAQHIDASPGKLTDTAVILDQARDVADLPGFSEGTVSVQDEASQIPARLLSISPGLRVLDACAAPGGKTCAMLERENSLHMLALDNEPQRLQKVEENLKRTDLRAQCLCADVMDVDAWWDGQPFDRILLDVPCSATGVIRRHPDIKLLRHREQVDKLIEKQAAILQTVWPCLKKGGLLLYTTCSVLPAENSEQIAGFCASHPEARHHILEGNWGLVCDYGRQLFPIKDGHDGFYYALLEKC